MAACLDAPHAHPRGAKSRFVPPAHTHWSAEVSNAERVPYLRQHLEHFIGVLTVIEFMVKRDESADANSCDGNASNHADLHVYAPPYAVANAISRLAATATTLTMLQGIFS